MIKRFSELANKITQKERNKLNEALNRVLKPTYFSSVPISEVQQSLHDVGFVVIQEDNTLFSGFFSGREGQARLSLGRSGRIDPATGMYKELDNAMLILSWHKMPSNKFEVTGYIS